MTRLSGGPLAPGVLEAMAEADAVSADMFEVQAHASRAIAAATGAEAGLVTAGASSGLLLAAAACLAGFDVARMNALPEPGDRSEIVVARGQRNGYDHALRTSGARLIEIGLPEALAGAGIRDAEPWEYESAIGPHTAAIHYVQSDQTRPALAAVADVAKRHGLPLIVDAAAELPPADNLRRFIAEGADLVVYSGGKVLGGPAGTGILCGRRDLVASAALQMLDMDVDWSSWHPPADFIDKATLPGLPRQGIGRCCKVGKHEVFGLLAALDHFVAEGDAVRHAHWLAVCEQIVVGSTLPPGCEATIEGADDTGAIPVVVLSCENANAAAQLRAALVGWDEPVHTGIDPFRPRCLMVNPVCLRPREIPTVIAALSG
ncbi:aminotransferase class V-fold PLP-dependent enzyme [Tropicimonas isoalkanivorans]|uniref:aminotransferase class V-fold PLP-dependent enzyme n=1 Tax=Tropicimonas isoalkanivorans TaxID=441112 RepID=UPI0011604234|nr:aminotransferase class V-fold PLP-dependent enzyme [Tropicimonas isoalkanivorans]